MMDCALVYIQKRPSNENQARDMRRKKWGGLQC
jgi:hypothetical protein